LPWMICGSPKLEWLLNRTSPHRKTLRNKKMHWLGITIIPIISVCLNRVPLDASFSCKMSYVFSFFHQMWTSIPAIVNALFVPRPASNCFASHRLESPKVWFHLWLKSRFSWTFILMKIWDSFAISVPAAVSNIQLQCDGDQFVFESNNSITQSFNSRKGFNAFNLRFRRVRKSVLELFSFWYLRISWNSSFTNFMTIMTVESMNNFSQRDTRGTPSYCLTTTAAIWISGHSPTSKSAPLLLLYFHLISTLHLNAIRRTSLIWQGQKSTL
jgi:hypothetical protein